MHLRARAQTNEKCTTTSGSNVSVGLQSIRDKYLPGEMIKTKVTEKALNLELELCLDLYLG